MRCSSPNASPPDEEQREIYLPDRSRSTWRQAHVQRDRLRRLLHQSNVSWKGGDDSKCLGRGSLTAALLPKKHRPSETRIRRSGKARGLATGLLVVSALFVPAIASAQEAASPAFKTLDSVEERVQGCVTCHGQSGHGTNNGAYPRIAGKAAGYLYNQLVAFRHGTRKYAPMNYLVAYLPDAYLCEMADRFAKLRPPFAEREQATANDSAMARGQALVTGGDSKSGVPACIACHGAGLTGPVLNIRRQPQTSMDAGPDENAPICTKSTTTPT